MYNRSSYSHGACNLKDYPMQIIAFVIGKYEITQIITGGCWRENCYIVQCKLTNNMFIIDPGSNFDDIYRFISKKVGDVKYILLTHAHHDHIGAAKETSDSSGAIIYLNKLDAKILQRAPLYAMRFTGKMVSIPNLSKIVFFDETEKDYFGDYSIELIHTPGHTYGSTCYKFGSFIFTGDTLLFEKTGRTDLPEGDKKKIKESIDRLLKICKPETILFPGHGRPFTGEEAKKWWQKFLENPPQDNAFES